jgi:hypothetical protein
MPLLLSGAGARLAATCLLLPVVVSCASVAPGASPPGATGPTPVPGPRTLENASPTGPASGMRVPRREPTEPAEPTGPVPAVNGCPSGTVAITHYPAWGDSTACVKAGSRLRLTLATGGSGTWAPVQVMPGGAATVASTTDSAGTMHAMVTPAGATAFCLSTSLTPESPTDPVYSWRLCVTVRR